MIIWRVASGRQILSRNSLFLGSDFASRDQICEFLDFGKYVIFFFCEVQPKTFQLHSYYAPLTSKQHTRIRLNFENISLYM